MVVYTFVPFLRSAPVRFSLSFSRTRTDSANSTCIRRSRADRFQMAGDVSDAPDRI